MNISRFHPKWNCWDRGGHPWCKWPDKHLVALILSVVLIVYIFVSAVLFQHLHIQATSEEATSERGILFSVDPNTLPWMTPSYTLWQDTRRAVRRAGGVAGSRLSEADREQWEEEYSCKGRNELLALWTRKQNESANSVTKEALTKLDDLFQEYSNLHRTCTHGGNMSYVSDLYKQPVNLNRTNCKFLVVEFGEYGVGNRVLWLASAYLYALLTQRVLLIDTRATIHEILCDPFAGSSWKLPQSFPYSSTRRWVMPGEFFEAWDAWEDGKSDTGHAKKAEEEEEQAEEGGREKEYTVKDLEKERKAAEELIKAIIDERRRQKREKEFQSGRRRSLIEAPSNSTRSTQPPSPNFNSTQANDGWSPNPRFFCGKDQERLQRVPWLSFSAGCLYFLPDLFAVPSFRPVLEELFPRRDPLTHLLRQIVYPVDPVWNRVLSVHKTHFRTGRRVIGMQVRYRNGGAMYRALNDMVNERIVGCARERDLIPDNSLASSVLSDILWNSHPPVVVFIASLHKGLQVHLRDYYAAMLERQMETGNQVLKLVQMSHSEFQAFDLDGDFQAFAELIMLSLVDELLTSPMSTFGYVAQAFAGLRPLVVEFDPRKPATCERAPSSDACYQMAVSKYTCPSDPELNGKLLPDVVPYLQPCQDTDGLQLVPPSDM